MKRQKSTVLFVLLALFLTSAAAQAQGVTPNPQDQRLQELYRGQLDIYSRSLQAGARQGGGGRGVPAGAVSTPFGVVGQPGLRVNWTGAWWTNTALLARLGLTDDQKAKIERAYENHRQKIVSSTALLEKEEAQLARLLEAETIDRNAVYSQIDRVTQARGEVERANSAMTLEMREALTRAQWMQLQPAPQRVRVGGNVLASNLISQVEPVYPELARQAGIQGPVVLEIEISKEGIVDNVRVLTGNPLLIQAAIDAVKQWRYKPLQLNNEVIPVVSTITVSFPFSAGGRGERGGPPAPAPPGGPGGRRGGRGPQ